MKNRPKDVLKLYLNTPYESSEKVDKNELKMTKIPINYARLN